MLQNRDNSKRGNDRASWKLPEQDRAGHTVGDLEILGAKMVILELCNQ